MTDNDAPPGQAPPTPGSGRRAPISTSPESAAAPGKGPRTASVVGIVLAAGEGKRMGMPKALKLTPDGAAWLRIAANLLADAGCSPVFAVLGAGAADAAALLSADGTGGGPPVVMSEHWAEGMSASLRAGLVAAAGTPATAALVIPVDMPGLPAAVLERLRGGSGGIPEATRDTLRQAVYAGAPAHPVLLGRAHWDAIGASITGDRGARAYLVANGVEEVECGDLFDGQDIDTPGVGPR